MFSLVFELKLPPKLPRNYHLPPSLWWQFPGRKSPYDRVWGIGLMAHDERAKNPASWQGQNLRGFALWMCGNNWRYGKGAEAS